MNSQKFLEILPDIASSPPALLAYIILVIAWITWLLRKVRSKDFIQALEALPENEKGPFAERSGYKYDDLAQLSQRDRLKLLTRRYLLFAFLATLAAVALLLLSWIQIKNNDTVSSQVSDLEDEMVTANAEIRADIKRVEQLVTEVLSPSQVRRDSSMGSASASPANIGAELKRVEQLLAQATSPTHTLHDPVRDPIRIQLAKDTLAKAYINAARAAKSKHAGADSELAGSKLKVIDKSSPELRWDDKDRLLVVTWTLSKYFEGLVGSEYTPPHNINLWVTVVPDIRNYCKQHKIEPDQVSLRLEQLLGLRPDSKLDGFVEFWVHPRYLFRPAPDPEISRSAISSEFPKDVSSEHIDWYNKIKAMEEDYPSTWTGLGYTYDWGNPASDVGLSEFVVKENAPILVHSIYSPESYCSNLS